MEVQNLHRLSEPSKCLNYITAGKCKVTLKSQKSGVHFTFMITKNEKSRDLENPMFFVKLLASGDSFFKYVGYMFRTDSKLFFSNHDSISKDTKSIVAFNYLVNQLNSGKLNPELEVLRSSVCCKCGKDLTTPESIEEGIGPECKKMLTKIGKW